MKVEIVREADLMGDMGMEDMAGGDMEAEGEAEVVDLEVAVAEGSEDDGDGFTGNFAYLSAFWAETRTTCIMNGQNETN
jgi:hypothetical protein